MTSSDGLGQPIIWITGASSGIGKAAAELYSKAGYKVIASSRHITGFDEDRNIEAMEVDVIDGQSLAAAAEKIRQNWGLIDKCIVNAGVCEYVDILPIEPDLSGKVMETNFTGAVNTVNAVIPILKPGGQIIAVSSQVVFAPFSRSEVYGASKAALDYFFKSLRIDLKDSLIDVTIIYPGFVKTPLTDKNDFPMPFIVSCEQMVEKMFTAIEQRKRQLIYPKPLYYFLTLSKICPVLWEKLIKTKRSEPFIARSH